MFNVGLSQSQSINTVKDPQRSGGAPACSDSLHTLGFLFDAAATTTGPSNGKRQHFAAQIPANWLLCVPEKL
jgi:hypothetical protein